MEINKYEEQAKSFLDKTNTSIKIEYLKHAKHFEDDEVERDIYSITLTRGDRSFSFPFGQSIAESGFNLINTNTNKEIKYGWFKELTYFVDRDKNKLKRDLIMKLGNLGCLKLHYGKTPSAYDVLSCLQVYEVGTHKDFCDSFGYDVDSIKANNIYLAVVKEYNNLKMLYSDKELELMAEIE